MNKDEDYSKLCTNAYSPGITYLSSCLTYTKKAANLNDTEKCNYCSENAIGRSGYNIACQYFSGPFVDKSHSCYGLPMDKCNSWTSDKNCCTKRCDD